MINHRLIIFYLSLLSIASVAKAQTVTLEECRNLAIQNNKSLKIASEKERIAFYEKKEALMLYFPKVSAMGGYAHVGSNLHLLSSSAIPSSIALPIPNLPAEIAVPQEIRDKIYKAGEIDLSNIWVAGITVTQPLYAGGKIIAANDIRSYAKELAKVMKEMQMTNVIVEVDEAYWQVISLTNKKKLAESYVELLKRMDSDVDIMLVEGVATKADRLTVSVKLNEAEMTLTKATNGVSLSKMLLAQICGLEIDEPLTLVDENMESALLDEDAITLPNIDDAIANRSEIRGLALGTKIYEKKEKIAFAEHLPTVGLMAGYVLTNPSMKNGIEHKFGGLFNIGVGVSVPLDFSSTSAKVNVAKTETKIKSLEMEEAKEKIRLQVNQSVYKLAEANKKLTAAKKNTEKADENLRYARVGFGEGVINASDVLAAQTAWAGAHSELIDAQIDLRLCKIYLNKSLGRKL